MDFQTSLEQYPAMNFDWRGKLILAKLAEGSTYREAAVAAGMTRQGILWRRGASPDFDQAVVDARERGLEERTFRLWLRSQNRGKRPPTGKGTRSVPRFVYGRR